MLVLLLIYEQEAGVVYIYKAPTFISHNTKEKIS